MNNSNFKRKLISVYEFIYEKKRIARLRLRYHLKIMTPDKTITYILKNKCSIARFGDGEFDLIFLERDLKFQDQSNDISIKLKRVLDSKNENLLICIPRCFVTVKGCNDHARLFWIDWGRNGHHERIINLVRNYSGHNYIFGDAQITRPYIDWKTDKRAKRLFPKLKMLWDNRDIIIVEGEQTRLGIGNDLYDNARSIKRILVPAVNSFESYDKIKSTVLDNYNDELIIMAIGPTATILASDLSELGIQALDIGNIDIEYEWFLRGAKDRIAIEGKFTNEAKDGRNYSECKDERYLSQIIAKVNC